MSVDNPIDLAAWQDKAQPVRVRLTGANGAVYELEGDVRLMVDVIEFAGKTYRFRGSDGRRRLYFETTIVRAVARGS